MSAKGTGTMRHFNQFTKEKNPVMYYHHAGYAPSQIASILGREAQSVREEVVSWWAVDKTDARSNELVTL